MDIANAPFYCGALEPDMFGGLLWLPTLLVKKGNQFLPRLRALPMANASSYRLRLLLEYCTILLWSWNHSNSKE